MQSCLRLSWWDGKAGTRGSRISRSVCEGGLESRWGCSLLFFKWYLAQLMLEEIPKNDDYRCQLQARRSFTVTDMLGHLLSILRVNILAQEPLLIVHTMITNPRHVWHSADLDFVWKIFFMGWIKMKFPKDAHTKVLVFKGLPVLSFFLANYWQCSCCFYFCFAIIQYMKNSMCLFTVPWMCQTTWAFIINMSSQHSFSRELSLHSFEVEFL